MLFVVRSIPFIESSAKTKMKYIVYQSVILNFTSSKLNITKLTAASLFGRDILANKAGVTKNNIIVRK
tara:strand:- start:147 stop:350 length:204 start_codon:yes stop_codon:yes gene_type:complete